MSQTQHELIVSAETAGQRIDRVVGEALGISRARLKDLFDTDKVRLDERRVKKGDLVREGQKIRVTVEETDPKPVPEPDAPLTVLLEDEALLFLDKQAKKPVHPLKSGETGTVANALVARYPECLEASTDAREAGLCHRLDIETSGVLLAARTRGDWESMRKAFSEPGRTDKRYWALVCGPIADDGEIDLPLRHDPKHPDRVLPAAEGGDDAREAKTDFRVLSRAADFSLVEARIHTGVLHQVRAHLAAVGAPLVGDERYGGPALEGLTRFFLHARALDVPHPRTGKRVRAVSPLPAELQDACARVGITPPE